MSKKKIVQHVGRLLELLRDRDTFGKDALFPPSILVSLAFCKDQMKSAIRVGKEEDFFVLVNQDLYKILAFAGLQNQSKAINDSPEILRLIIEELKELSALGLRGEFRDPNHALVELLNRIITWLEGKERLLNEYLLIQLK